MLEFRTLDVLNFLALKEYLITLYAVKHTEFTGDSCGGDASPLHAILWYNNLSGCTSQYWACWISLEHLIEEF